MNLFGGREGGREGRKEGGGGGGGEGGEGKDNEFFVSLF